MQEILVFPRSFLNDKGEFIQQDEAKQLIESLSVAVDWMPREEAESSEAWVQPIPCAIFRDASGKYCVFRQIRQRRKDLSQRLSLVVGGHVDRCAESSLLPEVLSETVKREVWEEVGIVLDHTPSLVGMVVDASSLMASRHVGFIYQVDVNTDVKSLSSEEFSIRSEYNGRFLNMEDHTKFRLKEGRLAFGSLQFDPWSSIIYAQYLDGGFGQSALPLFDVE